MRKVILFFIVIAVPFLMADCFFSQSYSATDSLQAKQAFAYPSLKGTDMGAAYAKLTNKSKAPLTLVKAESTVAARTEIHEMKMTNGIMEMRQLEKLTILPGDTAELKPGGNHIMLYEMKAPLELGQTFTITLYDDKGEKHVVHAKVEDRDLD